MTCSIVTLVLCSFAHLVNAAPNAFDSSFPDDIATKSGYVTVKENAAMFYWLYYQDPSFAPTYMDPISPVPIVVWLQGGPGASSTGYGNFEELGPLDMNMNRRNTSWTGLAHVLFVDNPVGTGYSYVNDSSAYCTDVDCVAKDLVTLFAGFFDDNPELRSNPFYIFCESYGGKMAAAAAQEMDKQIKAGTLDANLKGVGLGDSWISPIDSVNTWGEYLFDTSLLDWNGLLSVNAAAEKTQLAVTNQEWEKATQLWSLTEGVIAVKTDSVDFYNILFPHHQTSSSRKHKVVLDKMEKHIQDLYKRHVEPYAADPLDVLMQGTIADYLNIPSYVVWGSQSGDVFNEMRGDFMKPVITTVSDLIDRGLTVNVYNGMLDLIVDTPGQELWVEKMPWAQTSEFLKKSWTPMYAKAGADTGGYRKQIDNFEFWWVINAGHMVPADQGEFMLSILYSTITE